MIFSHKSRFIKSFVAVTLAMVMGISLFSPAYAVSAVPQSEDTYSGSDLWLRYVPVSNAELKAEYSAAISSIVVQENMASKLYRFADTDLYQTAYGVSGIQQPEGAKETVPQTTLAAARLELKRGLDGLLSKDVPVSSAPTVLTGDGAVIVGTPESSALIAGLGLGSDLTAVGKEGYIIRSVTIGGFKATAIAANTEIGALYGTYAFLRQLQTQKSISALNISDMPKVNHRRLNGWDRERLYSGNGNAIGGSGLNGESGYIFNWDLSPQSNTGNTAHSTAAAVRLPIVLDRYVVFARACASIGINEININNVNTNAAYLTEYVIRQEAALADALRPYGIKLSLSVNYGMPTMAVCNYQGTAYPKDDTNTIGSANATTMNPSNEAYQTWWADKSQQILNRIPDFLGFTVKANSEGQSGPQTYGFTHAQGANGMAKKLQQMGLTVFWRSFVYDPLVDNDRLNRAYMEFGPADDPNDTRDDAFLPNVFVQTKNGPLDFQPREPFHPMFGRMKHTNQAIELQITQEYTGQNKSLCFLAPMWEEVFKAETYAEGKGTLVGNVIDGSAQGQADTAIVGVHNIGNSDNFTGHQFGQANWFAFGRQAWNWTLTSEEIADDWARMTWSNDSGVVGTIKDIMLGSREALVSYQEPFGLMHQQNGTGAGHYPPSPWDWSGQDDWGPVYYNKADAAGLGFDRTVAGRIKAGLPVPEPGSINEKYFPLVNQYFPEVGSVYADIDTCPENLIAAFHHVPWDRTMKDGKSFWEDLVYRYQMGVQYVTAMREKWAALEGTIDARRFSEVSAKLATQEADAARWRDESIKYWRMVNELDMPVDGGPLSAKIVVGGREYGGFDLSWAINPNSTAMLDGSNSPAGAKFQNYKVSVPFGTAVPTISQVILADPDAKFEIIKQAESMADTAQVKVTKEDFFGTIVQNYTFEFVYDTSLKNIAIDGVLLATFEPGTTSYTAYVTSAAPKITAASADSAAVITVEQAAGVPGVATITVSNNGAPETVYKVTFGTFIAGSDEFDGASLDSKWSFVREDAANWSFEKKPGSVTITSQRGDLQGTNNTTSNNAKNLLLQDAPAGDWIIESKVEFSRAPATLNEQGGIIAYTDDNNYITLGWQIQNVNAAAGSQTGKFNVNMVREQNGTATAYNSQGIDMQRAAGPNCDTIWLRLVKKGNTYSGFFSSNGVDYRLVKLYSSLGATPALPTMNNDVKKVGVYAFNRNYDSVTPLDVSFDYFHLSSVGYEMPEEKYSFAAGIVGSNLTANLTNNSEAAVAGNIIVGVYDNAGRLVKTYSKTFDITPANSESLEFAIDPAYPTGQYTYKAFVWNSAYVPLTSAVTVAS